MRILRPLGQGAVALTCRPVFHLPPGRMQGAAAIVIGTDAYEDSVLTDLEHCVRDADLVESTLLEGGFCSRESLISLRNPSREVMFDTLDCAAKKTHTAACSSFVLLLYYAGHCYEDSGMIFMCPSSSKRREDDILVESFVQRLSTQTRLVCFFASCRTKLEFLTEEPVMRPSLAFPAHWHTRATARLRDVVGGVGRCRMFMLFGCHPGKDLPDDGLFTKILVKHMWQKNLDVHDLAKAVIQEVRLATQDQQWPLTLSNLDERVCLMREDPHCLKKVDACGLLDKSSVQRYVAAVRRVTREGDPNCSDFQWACSLLCGLPKAAKFYKRARPLPILQLCYEARFALNLLAEDDARVSKVPALTLMACLDELLARLMIARAECDTVLSAPLLQVSKLECARCVDMICSLLTQFDFDEFVTAKTFVVLQMHHQQLVAEELNLKHYTQAKYLASQAAPMYRSVGLPEGAAGVLMDCSWGAVQMRLLDTSGMRGLSQSLESLMRSFDDWGLPGFTLQYYELLACTQLACLYAGLRKHSSLQNCLPRVKQALAHPNHWLSRANKARNLLNAWEICFEDS